RMPCVLSLHEYLALIRSSAASLTQNALAAGPDDAVPTCPDWTARDLVVHQGIIHRWASGFLRGDPDAGQPLAETDILATVDDATLATWSRAGAAELLDALGAADADLDAMVFLNNAPRPREFWARRQAHETTIHSIDALACAMGRLPTAAETPVQTATG